MRNLPGAVRPPSDLSLLRGRWNIDRQALVTCPPLWGWATSPGLQALSLQAPRATPPGHVESWRGAKKPASGRQQRKAGPWRPKTSTSLRTEDLGRRACVRGRDRPGDAAPADIDHVLLTPRTLPTPRPGH